MIEITNMDRMYANSEQLCAERNAISESYFGESS